MNKKISRHPVVAGFSTFAAVPAAVETANIERI